MSALDQLTDVQRAAVVATAAAHLRNTESLAAELLPLLADKPTDPVIGSEPGEELAVKDSLTPASDPVFPKARTYAVSFTTAPPTTWSPS